MSEVTEQRPMNNEYANSRISKLSPVTLRGSTLIASPMLEILDGILLKHRMDKRKSVLFPRQYRNCFSRRINALVLRN